MGGGVTRSVVVGGFIVALLGCSPAAAYAQGGFEWPERSENLQVLPEDLPADQLRAVMQGFTRSLGVRCSHCHVGEEGQPLSAYDFVSDDNPNKKTARTMIELVRQINESLAGIEPSGPERVTVRCQTCHNGKPRPLTLGEALGEAMAEGGLTMAQERFQSLRDRYYGAGGYDFSEAGVTRIASEWLQAGQSEGAVWLLRRNTEDYPESSSAWTSLGQGLEATGDTAAAIRSYERALEVDPDNRRARTLLERVRGG